MGAAHGAQVALQGEDLHLHRETVGGSGQGRGGQDVHVALEDLELAAAPGVEGAAVMLGGQGVGHVAHPEEVLLRIDDAVLHHPLHHGGVEVAGEHVRLALLAAVEATNTDANCQQLPAASCNRFTANSWENGNVGNVLVDALAPPPSTSSSAASCAAWLK